MHLKKCKMENISLWAMPNYYENHGIFHYSCLLAMQIFKKIPGFLEVFLWISGSVIFSCVKFPRKSWNYSTILPSSVASLRRSASIAPQFLSMMTVLTDTSSPELQYSTIIVLKSEYNLRDSKWPVMLVNFLFHWK